MGSMLIFIPIIVAILLAAVLFKHRRKRNLQMLTPHEEPHLGIPDKEILTDESTEEDQNNINDELTVDQQEKMKPTTDNDNDYTGVIAMRVLAREGYTFAGYELLQCLLSNGLRYGKMHIFHRHEEINGKGPILFSLASAAEPGTFELAKMGSFKCYGLSLFMRVSGQKDLSQSLEIMINTAKQLAEDLGGELLDEKRQTISNETITHWRQRIKAYEQGQYTADLFD